MDLTVGMATYRDFDGVYFTVQALRLYQDMEGVELVVVDNFGCEATRAFVEESVGGRYILDPHVVGTSGPATSFFAKLEERRSCASTATFSWRAASLLVSSAFTASVPTVSTCCKGRS